MTDIPKEALEKAYKLSGNGQPPGGILRPEDVLDAFARYIADVSEKAKIAVEQSTFAGQLPAHISPLQSLILADPEDDLLKEAREICAAVRKEEDWSSARNYLDGFYDDTEPMRCTLAALRRNR